MILFEETRNVANVEGEQFVAINYSKPSKVDQPNILGICNLLTIRRRVDIGEFDFWRSDGRVDFERRERTVRFSCVGIHEVRNSIGNPINFLRSSVEYECLKVSDHEASNGRSGSRAEAIRVECNPLIVHHGQVPGRSESIQSIVAIECNNFTDGSGQIDVLAIGSGNNIDDVVESRNAIKVIFDRLENGMIACVDHDQCIASVIPTIEMFLVNALFEYLESIEFCHQAIRAERRERGVHGPDILSRI